MAADKPLRHLACTWALVCGLTGASAAHAAEIQLFNLDEPDQGFNDPTPAAPVGGNPGETLGDQRARVLQAVADFWGRRLQSPLPIQVATGFAPAECTPTSGALAGATPLGLFSDFPNAPRARTWYPPALANKLAGVKLNAAGGRFGTADIVASFNGEVGQPGCLEGLRFYLGLDGKPPAGQLDLMKIAIHEFAHGLGFQTFTDEESGSQLGGQPSVWDHFLYDLKQHKRWVDMDSSERSRSTVGWRNLVWAGKATQTAASRTLKPGVPDLLTVTTDGIDNHAVAPSLSGAQIDAMTAVAGTLVRVKDQADGRQACSPLDAANAATVRGNVLLIDADGECDMWLKTRNAQAAGAVAVIMAPLLGTGFVDEPLPVHVLGNDPRIKIAAVGISRSTADKLKRAIAARTSRASFPVWVVLYANLAKLNGADAERRPYMYTDFIYRPGSSVSHFDTSSKPHLLMQPGYSGVPRGSASVSAPQDLTLELLQDIGW